MREHPILFSGEMVRALLAGRKTQTRRMSKRWLRVKAGDRLWVRETWAPFEFCYDGLKPSELPPCQIVYLASQSQKLSGDTYRPSIHMPRWASRILLEATADARLERLQWITEEDAEAEGVECALELSEADIANIQISDDPPHLKELARLLGPGKMPARGSYRMLWDELHGKDAPWSSNPEVVVLSFRVLSAPAGGDR